MKKHPRLSGPPAWQKRVVVFLMGLLGATLLLFVVWAYFLWIETGAVEDCTDRGGTWNYETKACEGARWE